LSGITLLDKNNHPKKILVQGNPVEKRNLLCRYKRLPSERRDNMSFFSKGIQTYDLNYKLRNILIDYFKEVDTIPVINTTRISVE
jgi:hypothetical protein